MQTVTIAIIGGGHMGSSLLGGLIANHYDPQKIWVTDPDVSKIQHLKEQFNINITTDNHAAAKQADVVLLAVKPQIFHEVAEALATTLQSNQPLIISIAAGIKVESIQKWVGGNLAIVRAMPNTPALIGCGATALFCKFFRVRKTT